MRKQELLGPLLVAVLTVLAIGAWSFVFATQGGGSGPTPAAATASSDPSSDSGADTGTGVVVVGDSWTDPRTQPAGSFVSVAAEQLAWQPTVLAGGSGTGYLSRGPAEAGTFAERLDQQTADPEVDLVVVQGGSADEPFLVANPTISLADAARRTVALAHERYAEAEVVVLGPVLGPTPGPVLRSIDRTLGRAARASDATYVSPLRRGWLTGEDAATSLDETTGLPNTLGRARLADRFETAVRALPVS